MSRDPRAMIPWRAKLALKALAGRAPIAYRTLRRLGMGVHGAMDEPDYAVAVFERHFLPVRADLPTGFHLLELGPGDSVAGALCGRAHGAGHTWLVDAGPFATREPATYAAVKEALHSRGVDVDGVEVDGGFDEMLVACHATYLTAGVSSMQEIPDASVDFAYSQAVLEHVLRDEFDALATEMYRCLKPGAVASHRIDLQDHLARGLNNLRYSDRFWESRWIRESGSYTNRLRYSEILQAFENAGFETTVTTVDRWATLPIARRHLAPRFAAFDDDELTVQGFDVTLRRPT